MNMYTAVTRTYMCDEALVRCLPVSGTGLTLTPLIFSVKTVKQPSAGCCDPVFKLDHSIAWPEILYGIDSLFRWRSRFNTACNAATPKV